MEKNLKAYASLEKERGTDKRGGSAKRATAKPQKITPLQKRAPEVGARRWTLIEVGNQCAFINTTSEDLTPRKGGPKMTKGDKSVIFRPNAPKWRNRDRLKARESTRRIKRNPKTKPEETPDKSKRPCSPIHVTLESKLQRSRTKKNCKQKRKFVQQRD